MRWPESRSLRLAALLLCAFANTAVAEGYVLGGGIGGDDSGGVSLAALADFSIGQSTWLTMSAGLTNADTFDEPIRTRSANLSLLHQFKQWGVSAEAGIWGDSGLLESTDVGASIFWMPGRWRLSAEIERRDVELTLRRLVADPVLGLTDISAGANADGVGASVRYRTIGGASVSLRAKRFDYDRNLNRLASIELIRRLSPSTLTLAGALRDFEASLGIEWERGEHLLGIEYGRDRLAVGEFDVDSVTGSWALPAGKRTDMEFSLGYSRSEGQDGTLYAGVYLYFFGG